MNKVEYEDYVAGYGPSPAIWGHMPSRLVIDPAEGIYLWEDFLDFPATAHDAAGKGWLYTGTNPVTTVAQNSDTQATVMGGVVRIGATGTDEDDAYLIYGNNVNGSFMFTAGQELWYEARIKPSSITSVAFMGGLIDPAISSGHDLLTDTTTVVIATNNFVGFHSLYGTPTVVRAATQHASVAVNDVTSGTGTLGAAAWIKLGLSFMHNTLKFFIDGVQVGADIAVDSTPTPTSFPYGHILTPVFGVKDRGGAAKYLDIDWVRVAMQRPKG